MKYIMLFENYDNKPNNDIDSLISSHLQTSTFDELPLIFKKGLLTWMYEGDPVEWSIDVPITDWNNDRNVNILINDYSKQKGNNEFKYGYLPTKLIIKKLTPIIIEEYGYSSFEEWHQAYQSTNEAEHELIFPIIIGDDYEWIYDGWHRLNYYLYKGIDKIPVIEL